MVKSSLTKIVRFDLSLFVKTVPSISLNQAQRQEVARWIEHNQSALPEAVRLFLVPHQKYLATGGDLRRAFDEVYRELRRALGITPSSERRGRSARPKSYRSGVKDTKADVEQRLTRSDRLGDWHHGLYERHTARVEKLQKRLAKMEACSMSQGAAETQNQAAEAAHDEQTTEITIDTPVEQIELTEQQQAECKAAGRQLAEHLSKSYAEVDPALQSVQETLMPTGTVVNIDQMEQLVVQMPDELADATVVKELSDTRVRYDIVLSLNRIELKVPKQVVVTGDGQRTVVSASTDAYGPPRYSVTWSALATLAVLVGQFALPLHRIATLFSASGKTFDAGGLSRLLHYVAMRLVPLYLQLSEQLADSEILSGDDTSCRVVEVSSTVSALKTNGSKPPQSKPPPWAAYRNPAAAQASITACEQRRNDRQKRRAAGDRNAKPTPDEEPSLAMLLGRALQFESPLVRGGGNKQSMNTTVVTGRSDGADPRSLIVLYRSHLGGYANLLESILQNRSPNAGDLIVQADLSQTGPDPRPPAATAVQGAIRGL